MTFLTSQLKQGLTLAAVVQLEFVFFVGKRHITITKGRAHVGRLVTSHVVAKTNSFNKVYFDRLV